MEIRDICGKPVTVAMRELKSGEVFRYVGGSNLYLITEYTTSNCSRLAVNLNNGGSAWEEKSKQVVPIREAYVTVNDSFFTPRGE